MFNKGKKYSKEFISTRQEIKESTKFSLKSLIDGNVLSREVVTRQIPFIAFIGLALLLYILNQYQGENVMRRIMFLEKRVRELRAEAVSTGFDLQELSKQSEVSRMVTEQGLPLQEAMTPPFKIILDE
jgi:hypothetical protein